MEKKIRVGIIFGGKSAEHEVSLQSARNVIEAIDKKKYEPVLIGIDKTGQWFLQDRSHFLLHGDDPKLIRLNDEHRQSTALVPQSEGKMLLIDAGESDKFIDVAFPLVHGTFGEDGTLQGLLKLADIPFVGASVLGSAVGMDKDVMKRLLRDAGIPVSKFLVVKEKEMPSYTDVVATVGTPCFVKPANAGSSVGVSKVKNEEDFFTAIEEAFRYDRKILIEEYIQGREIECAVLGNDDPIASVPGEIIPQKEFYSYEAKYIDVDGAAVEIPAKLSGESIKKIQAMAIRTFEALSCEGLGRVDFFLKENGDVYVNEINTLPGFTSISMYPKLWAESGIAYPDLIDRLIELAFERFETEQKLTTSYKDGS